MVSYADGKWTAPTGDLLLPISSALFLLALRHGCVGSMNSKRLLGDLLGQWRCGIRIFTNFSMDSLVIH